MKKKLLIVITDVLSVCIAYGLALLLRFDMRYSAVPSEYIRGYLFYIILASVILVSSYTIAKLYRSVWTYAGIPEVLRTFVTSGIAAAITGVTYTISVIRMPISFYLVGWGLVFALTASSRMMYRLLRRVRIKAEGVKANPVRQNIMIIGAGAAGLMLLKEYRTSYYLTDKVKIFIDDNEEKWNKYLDGVRIAGGRDQILASVDKYTLIRSFWRFRQRDARMSKQSWRSVIRQTARSRPCRVYISWSTVKSMYQNCETWKSKIFWAESRSKLTWMKSWAISKEKPFS